MNDPVRSIDPPPETPPRRRWHRPRISLRGLMMLILVVGVLLGWTVNQVNRVRTQRRAVAAVLRASGWVLYDDEFSADPARMRASAGRTAPAGPAWLRRWLGEDWSRTAVAVVLPPRDGSRPEVPPEVGMLDGLVSVQISAGRGGIAWGSLGRLRRLELVELAGSAIDDGVVDVLLANPGIRSLTLRGVRLTDGGVARLAGMPVLEELTIVASPGIGDAGVARLLAGGRGPGLRRFRWRGFLHPLPDTVRALAGHHPRLEELVLKDGPVGDLDLAPLGPLARLATLDLTHTDVTDAGVARLAKLPVLDRLKLDRTRTTAAGLDALRGAPSLRVLELPWTEIAPEALARFAAASPRVTLTATSFRPVRSQATVPPP